MMAQVAYMLMAETCMSMHTHACLCSLPDCGNGWEVRALRSGKCVKKW